MTLGSTIPKSTILTVPIFLYILFVSSRFLIKNFLALFFLEKNEVKLNNQKKYAILGAENIEYQIYEYLTNFKNNLKIQYFVDDDPKFKNRTINNIEIISTKKFLKKKERNLLLYVGEKFSKTFDKKQIKNKFGKYVSRVVFAKIINKKIELKSLEENILDIEDLIPSSIDHKDLIEANKYLEELSILVTGGGGSIGSELVSQLYLTNVKKIIVIDNSEYNLFKIQDKINQLAEYKKNKKTEISYHLSDVSDENIIKSFKDEKIDGIFHAAAYKHVDLVEKNVFSGVKNNIFSSYYLCKYFYQKNLKFFVLVSTDKAVRPKSVMGITKNISERIVNYYNNKTPTKFYSVRFGNVINSSGSVIPIFKNQILSGNKITITNKKASRYFMSIPEAVSLILCSTSLKINTDVFYFNMGKSIKIFDLAKKITSLFGKKLVKKSKNNDEVEYKIIGLRKGEKLFEELLIPKKNKLKKTRFKNILYLSDSKKKQKQELPDFKILNKFILNKNKLELLKYLNRFMKDEKK
jgi:FlaA1/EpsC-like NDP-sugar epimerase